jgi:hypothetical protein
MPGKGGSCPYPNGYYECVYQDKTLCLANTSKDEARFEFQLEDQRIRDSCVGNLELAARSSGPSGEAAKGFFVGCGLHKPHVPWIIPHEFINLYPSSLDDIPLAPHRHVPAGAPDVAWHFPYGAEGFHIKFNGTCNETLSRIYRRGYAAAVSYSDYNIGVLLKRLDTLNLTAETLVAVIGDHGWHLGDKDTWAKMTAWEAGVRIPLIVRCPWKPAAVGKITNVLAEAVDLYPTIVALVGLPSPLSEGEELNGTSLEPVFDAPDDTAVANGLKTAAFSQLAKANLQDLFQIGGPPSPGGPAHNTTQIMGYSVRTAGWRYTCWFKFDNVTIVPITTPDAIIGRELYDHRADEVLAVPGTGETVNVVDDAAHEAVVEELHAAVLGYIRLYPVSPGRLAARAGPVAEGDRSAPNTNVIGQALIVPPLPPIHSISGVSSGGGMAANHLMAFSSAVQGAAIVAGNPYGCGPVMGNGTSGSCYTDKPPMDYQRLHAYTHRRAAEGLIDPLLHLKRTRLYLYGGTQDTIVYQVVMIATQRFFSAYVSPGDIEAVWNISSQHGYITDSYGQCCNCSGAPYFHNCSYDQAGAILRHMYGDLQPRAASVADHFKLIDQRKHMPPGRDVGMVAEGLAYVPTACTGNISSCRIHVDYHGCISLCFGTSLWIMRWQLRL